MTCNYQGYEFGGGYLDSVCVDGQLYDADYCDDEGGLYEPPVYYPCPGCSPLEAMDVRADDWIESLDCERPRWSAWHLVMDIRRNREMETISFARYVLHRLRVELLTLDADWWFRLGRWFR